MGSPSFAAPSLTALHEAGHDLCLVVTQQSRPAGRGRREREPGMALLARSLGLAVFQPERVRHPGAVARIAEMRPDAIVVVAYGQILPRSILAIPPLGCVNVHPSLLPRHRGATPIAGALLAGDVDTGVSIMLMDHGMDTGPVLSQHVVRISDADDVVTLGHSLATLGAELLAVTLPQLSTGTLTPQPQDERYATLTRPSVRADGLLDWAEPAQRLWRRVRAYADWPLGHTWWDGKLVRIRAARWELGQAEAPGRVVGRRFRGGAASEAAIGTGDGYLLPTQLGIEGGKLMAADAFLRGHPSFAGSDLTSHS